MNFVLVILAIGAVSVSAHKNWSEDNFEKQKLKQPQYKQPPTWSMPNYPTNWPSNLNQPLNWQNQPSLPWQSQQPTQPTMYWPNQPGNYPGTFGQGNQIPYSPLPHTNMNWQSPQVMPGSLPPSYGSNFPYPQMYLYRMKNSEKL